MTSEKLSRIVVLVSAVAAVGVTLYLSSGTITTLPAYGAIAFVLGFLGARFRPGAAIATVLLACYLTPVAITLAFGPPYIAAYFSVWLAAMVGLITGSSGVTRWRIGPALRVPLALWALTVAVAWPIVALREFDFAPVAIWSWNVSNAGIGVLPKFAALGVANAAATQLVSLLCLDWIVGRYSNQHDAWYEREVVLWLGVGTLVSIAVALYQATVDITFLNSGLFAAVGRASGTLRDANPYGILAAIWAPAAVALLMALGHATWFPAVLVLVISWCGLWVSGSRNALAVSVIGLGVVVWHLWPTLSRRSQAWLVIGCGAMISATVGFAVLVRGTVISPVARFIQTFPVATRTAGGITGLVASVWDRYHYGAIARRMIHDFPWFGVGEGTFSLIVVDYGRAAGDRLTVDNAQNWFRHQFAELGVIGSLGWIIWTLMFAYLIVTARSHDRSKRSMTGIVRFLPIMFTLVSLVGMPTMSAPAAITFSLFAAWYLLLIDSSALDRMLRPVLSSSSLWIVMWALVAIFAAGTAYSARHGLRVAARAAKFDWPYAYGFSGQEVGPAGQFRWTERRGVIVLDAAKPWMKLTVSVNHADVARKPVDVKVWRDGEEVLRTTLHSTDPVTEYVHVPAGEQRFVLETQVNRVVRPADFGLADTRELGLMVAWDFVDSPP